MYHNSCHIVGVKVLIETHIFMKGHVNIHINFLHKLRIILIVMVSLFSYLHLLYVKYTLMMTIYLIQIYVDATIVRHPVLEWTKSTGICIIFIVIIYM